MRGIEWQRRATLRTGARKGQGLLSCELAYFAGELADPKRRNRRCSTRVRSRPQHGGMEGIMLGTWIRFVAQSTLLALEAQRVIALRMAAIATGGTRAQAEIQRMVLEKVVASMRAGAMLSMGKPTASIVRHYRSRVRANERRLLRVKSPRPVRRG